MVVKVKIDPSRNWTGYQPDLPVDPSTGLPQDLPVNRLPMAEPPKTLPTFLRRTAADMPAVPSLGQGEEPDADLAGYTPFDPASIPDPVQQSQALEGIYRSGIQDDEEAQRRQELSDNELAGRQQYHQRFNPETGLVEDIPINMSEYEDASLAEAGQRPQIPGELVSNLHQPERATENLQQLGSMMHSSFYPSKQKTRDSLIKSRNSTSILDFNAHRNELDSMLRSESPAMASAQQYIAEAMSVDATPDDYDILLNVSAAANMVSLGGLMSLKDTDVDNITGEPTTAYSPDLMDEEKFTKSIQHYLANAISRIPAAKRIFTPKLMDVFPAILARMLQDLDYIEKVNNPDTGKPELRRTSSASGEKLLASTEVAEVIAGDYLRRPASLVPVNEKASVTAPSKGIKGKGKQSVSQAVINILGSMGESVNANALNDKTIQLTDIMDNYNPQLGYSTSIWADRNGLGKKTYDSILTRFKRERDPKTNRPLYTEEEHKQHAREHTVKVMWSEDSDKNNTESAIQKMKRSIKYASTLSTSKRPVYTGRIRDPLNQRMYRNRAMTDVGADKVGLRDMVTPFVQTGVTYKVLFDPEKIKALQARIGSKQVPWGRKFSEWYDRSFTPEEQSALEYMSEATRQLLREDNINWDNVPWEELVLRYKPSFGNILADRGDLLKRWRLGETGQDIDANNKLLADIDKGEWLSYAAVWDDFSSIRNLKDTSRFHQLTSIITDDGTQNGIFLQALYAGLADKAQLLGTPGTVNKNNEPWSGEDLRRVLWDTVFSANAKQGLDEDVHGSWDQFFHEIQMASGDKFKGILNTFGKAALMQYAYGKNAAMFGDQMDAFLSDVAGQFPDAYNTLVTQYLGENKTEEEMLNDLTQIMANSLMSTVSPGFTDTNKKLGLGFSWLDVSPTISGAVGDAYEFGQRFLGIKYLGDELTKFEQIGEGEDSVFAGTRSPASVSLPGGDIRQAEFSNSARAVKPSQWFKDRKTGDYREYKQFIGQGLSNQLGVMPVQCMDGDLLKMMILHVNADRKSPLYADTVHDSIRTTAHSRRHYINAYNNVGIPQITKWMETYRKQIVDNYLNNRKKLMDKVSADGMPVVIGLNGQYAAISAYIDAQYDKFYGVGAEEYAERISREYGEQSYIKSKNRTDEFLKQARMLGWFPEGEPIRAGKITVTDPTTIRQFRDNMAVSPKKFPDLFSLLEDRQRIKHSELELWARNGTHEVKRALRALINDQRVQRFGIYQMGTR